ncbi:MAG: sortase [Candidatus Spyradocola sp.]
MTRKTGFTLVIAGMALMLLALSLLLFNRQEDAQAGREAETLLADVRNASVSPDPPSTPPAFPTNTSESPAPTPTATSELTPSAPDPTVADCMGILAIPSLELELPVLEDWSYAQLKRAPCRQFGAPETDDLVIAAHNYASHFGHLRQLDPGDKVTFTELDGNVHTYLVAEVRVLEPTQVDAVLSSGHALTLYTCTKGGKSRVVVFCDRDDAE